jgi:chromate transporter
VSERRKDAGGSTGRISELFRLFARLGTIGFGGPTAHIGMMQDEVVRRRGWMANDDFTAALAATNILPGPNSTEMAIHIGYRRGGVRGGVVAGMSFILPAFVLMLGLSWAYFRWSGIASVADTFDGIKPAVIAILTVTLWRLSRSSVRDTPQLSIMATAGVLAYVLTAWEPLILVAAGGVGVILYSGHTAYPRLPFNAGLLSVAPLWLVAPVIAAAALSIEPGVLVHLLWVFLRAGGLLFGGGYVLIPLIQHDVVERYGWLTQREFLDGVALGQATPGPIVITSTFVGYGAAGFPGAFVATMAVFFPSFLFAITAGRFLDGVRSWQPAMAFLRGVGPAVVGTIAAVSAQLGRDSIVDGWTAVIFVGGLGLAWRYGPIQALAVAGVAGVATGRLT